MSSAEVFGRVLLCSHFRRGSRDFKCGLVALLPLSYCLESGRVFVSMVRSGFSSGCEEEVKSKAC